MQISKEIIREEAKRIGFTFCGFAKAEPLEHRREFYRLYLGQKRHGELDYLETQLEKRLDPCKLIPEAKTVIGLLMSYFPPEIIPSEDNYIIAKYAYGSDHHPFMNKRLQRVVDLLKTAGSNIIAKPFLDSGVVQEKYWAQQCGLGWQGKNTILINKKQGSFFFIGIILTNLELEPDQPESDHCGKCGRCMSACPTGALKTPYQLEITRCLSYHTIETVGGFPDELRPMQSDRIFGCDICQDVCPYNHKPVAHNEQELFPSEELKKMRKEDWRHLTEEKFNHLFSKSSIRRTGYKKLKMNIG